MGTGDRVEVRPKKVAPFVQLQVAKLRIPTRLYSYVVWPDKWKGNFLTQFPYLNLVGYWWARVWTKLHVCEIQADQNIVRGSIQPKVH